MKSEIKRNIGEYMPVTDVCCSISDTYKDKSQFVTLINTSDVLDGVVLNHERVPNKNLRGQFKKIFRKEDILYITEGDHESEVEEQMKRVMDNLREGDDTERYLLSTKEAAPTQN